MPIQKETELIALKNQLLSLQDEIILQNEEIEQLRSDKILLRKQIIDFNKVPES